MTIHGMWYKYILILHYIHLSISPPIMPSCTIRRKLVITDPGHTNSFCRVNQRYKKLNAEIIQFRPT